MAVLQTRRSVSLSTDTYDAAQTLASYLGLSLAHFFTELVRCAVPDLPATVHFSRDEMKRAGERRGSSRRRGWGLPRRAQLSGYGYRICKVRRVTPDRVVGHTALQRIYIEARNAIPTKGHSYHSRADDAMRQSYLRRVSIEFHRRLKEAGIEVEGAPS